MQRNYIPSRRNILTLAAGAGTLALTHLPLRGQNPPERPPQLKPEAVYEFVRVGHGNLDRVKEMLEQEPSLLNACWDWGGGDWETAIGGAGHMGRKDIALYLLSRGARMDIFVAAMLGRLDILEPTLKAFPELIQSRGPHGITLMTHAKKGGSEAQAVVAYLDAQGIKS